MEDEVSLSVVVVSWEVEVVEGDLPDSCPRCGADFCVVVVVVCSRSRLFSFALPLVCSAGGRAFSRLEVEVEVAV